MSSVPDLTLLPAMSIKGQISEASLIAELWKEHVATPFPKDFRAKDVAGINCIRLEADIAGCVVTFLQRGTLNLIQTAVLGLCYRHASYITPIFNEEGSAYFRRLERLAELVLKAVALKSAPGK